MTSEELTNRHLKGCSCWCPHGWVLAGLRLCANPANRNHRIFAESSLYVPKRIYDQLKHLLKPKDYEVLSSRSPRWQVKIEFLKHEFVRMGYIRYAGTGIWEITDAGREYLKQLQAEEAHCNTDQGFDQDA